MKPSLAGSISINKRAEFERLPPRAKETRARVLEALSEARLRGLPLSRAVREAGTTVRTVVRYAAEAVERLPNGRYRVLPDDRLVRVISVGGPVWVDTRSSRLARLASAHANAVREYGLVGDPRVFDPFRGRRVGGSVLATDVALLAAIAVSGELDAFDLYEETAS